MEKNDENVEIQKTNSKIQSMKMQDFFGIFDLKKSKDDNKDKNENKKEKIDSFLHSYPSAKITYSNINIAKTEPIKKNGLNNNINNINQLISFDESVNIFIDESNIRNSHLVIQNYECKFYFDDKVL